jgi:hypothetical protein
MKALQRLGRDAIQQGGTIAYWQGSELNVGTTLILYDYLFD